MSSVTQSIVFAHSFRQTNFFTLFGDKDARSLVHSQYSVVCWRVFRMEQMWLVCIILLEQKDANLGNRQALTFHQSRGSCDSVFSVLLQFTVSTGVHSHIVFRLRILQYCSTSERIKAHTSSLDSRFMHFRFLNRGSSAVEAIKMLSDRVGFLPWQKVFLPGQW